MDKIVSSDLWDEMLLKSYCYDVGIAPVVAEYRAQVGILLSITIGLSVALIVFIVLYLHERALKRYFKRCLNLNFGWFK